ncbi:hypothetical protein DQ04_04931040 [Trypanosoma grayi]|uniref:hypothetical protein n=1 Tax=Trypanosoma grayi TaxID=71804 RepID=UPI0004F493CD|nr:hypothetical protein DQ04_04931040 [Trypanosoma grayi]KEG09623.1 hypothetical protein DQ04_04931040 [Trypanosoma grayi]
MKWSWPAAKKTPSDMEKVAPALSLKVVACGKEFVIPVDATTRVGSLRTSIAEMAAPNASQRGVPSALFLGDKALPESMRVSKLPLGAVVHLHFGADAVQTGGCGDVVDAKCRSPSSSISPPSAAANSNRTSLSPSLSPPAVATSAQFLTPTARPSVTLVSPEYVLLQDGRCPRCGDTIPQTVLLPLSPVMLSSAVTADLASIHGISPVVQQRPLLRDGSTVSAALASVPLSPSQEEARREPSCEVPNAADVQLQRMVAMHAEAAAAPEEYMIITVDSTRDANEAAHLVESFASPATSTSRRLRVRRSYPVGTLRELFSLDVSQGIFLDGAPIANEDASFEALRATSKQHFSFRATSPPVKSSAGRSTPSPEAVAPLRGRNDKARHTSEHTAANGTGEPRPGAARRQVNDPMMYDHCQESDDTSASDWESDTATRVHTSRRRGYRSVDDVVPSCAENNAAPRPVSTEHREKGPQQKRQDDGIVESDVENAKVLRSRDPRRREERARRQKQQERMPPPQRYDESVESDVENVKVLRSRDLMRREQREQRPRQQEQQQHQQRDKALGTGVGTAKAMWLNDSRWREHSERQQKDKAPESDVENAKVMHPHKQQQQEGETVEGSVAASAPDGKEHREDTLPQQQQQQQENGNTESDAEEVKVLRSRDHRRREHRARRQEQQRRDKAPESDVENAKVMHPHKQQQQQEGETAEGSVAASAPDGMEHREDTSQQRDAILTSESETLVWSSDPARQSKRRSKGGPTAKSKGRSDSKDTQSSTRCSSATGQDSDASSTSSRSLRALRQTLSSVGQRLKQKGRDAAAAVSSMSTRRRARDDSKPVSSHTLRGYGFDEEEVRVTGGEPMLSTRSRSPVEAPSQGGGEDWGSALEKPLPVPPSLLPEPPILPNAATNDVPAPSTTQCCPPCVSNDGGRASPAKLPSHNATETRAATPHSDQQSGYASDCVGAAVGTVGGTGGFPMGAPSLPARPVSILSSGSLRGYNRAFASSSGGASGYRRHGVYDMQPHPSMKLTGAPRSLSRIRITVVDPYDQTRHHYNVAVEPDCPVGILRRWMLKKEENPMRWAVCCGKEMLRWTDRLSFYEATGGRNDCVFSFFPREPTRPSPPAAAVG